MSATGLDVFDKTVQTTNIWLKEIEQELGPDHHVAWHALGAVLRAVRDRMPVELAANFGAELPLLVRGAFYDHFKPEHQPLAFREADAFLALVAKELAGGRPVNTETAVHAVLGTVSHHVPAGALAKAREAMPKDVRRLWPEGSAADAGAAH